MWPWLYSILDTVVIYHPLVHTCTEQRHTEHEFGSKVGFFMLMWIRWLITELDRDIINWTKINRKICSLRLIYTGCRCPTTNQCKQTFGYWTTCTDAEHRRPIISMLEWEHEKKHKQITSMLLSMHQWVTYAVWIISLQRNLILQHWQLTQNLRYCNQYYVHRF